jgi:hypothetical protein
MKQMLLATVALVALATPALAEVNFPTALQGQWCIPSTFKKAPGEPVPHTVCMGVSSNSAEFNRSGGVAARLTEVSPNEWRVEFEKEEGDRRKWTAAWRLEGKRLVTTDYYANGGKKSTNVWVLIKPVKPTQNRNKP